ncbi:multicopper oxidase family protein, partial [Bacillus sp. NTK034]|nr:multicopper oxidase family protein [Bacillus sp. NTK034]
GMDHSNMGSEEDSDKEADSEDSSMSGMDHGSMGSDSNDSMNGMGHDMSAYDIFSINGKSGDSIEPLKVKEGEKV